jgi:dTDP-4-dehydrorhamnose 3,5-epimerase
MIFTETPLQGAYLVAIEFSCDTRGGFGRAFSAREFREHGLEFDLTEVSVSRNLRTGTLRGMHYQLSPHEETKLVRVTQGAAFDVIVDLRFDSPSRGQWFGIELSAANATALYIPKGFAHGFLTLEENTEILYQISDTFMPLAVAGFAWNDPSIGISWPMPPRILSEKDRMLSNL